MLTLLYVHTTSKELVFGFGNLTNCDRDEAVITDKIGYRYIDVRLNKPHYYVIMLH